MRRVARGADEVHDVILHFVVHVDVVDHFARGEDGLGVHDRARAGQSARARHQIEDLTFLLAVRVADAQFQHETVHLRFRQRISPFLLDRILRGEHEERFFKFERLIADGDLLFLHRFEQRALDLGGRAIDFVGEHEMGEDGAAPRGERAGLRIVNLRADDIGGQHVRRELQSREFDVDAGGE